MDLFASKKSHRKTQPDVNMMLITLCVITRKIMAASF